MYLTELRKIGVQPVPQRLKMTGRLCVLEGRTGDLRACAGQGLPRQKDWITGVDKLSNDMVNSKAFGSSYKSVKELSGDTPM